MYTQKHLHKRKGDCFNFHPCPLFLLSLSLALFLVKKIYMLFFSGSFMQRLSSADCPSPPTQSLHKHSWQEVEALHDTVACRPTNPSQSTSQQALSCVSLWNYPSFGVCVCVCVCVCVWYFPVWPELCIGFSAAWGSMRRKRKHVEPSAWNTFCLLSTFSFG